MSFLSSLIWTTGNGIKNLTAAKIMNSDYIHDRCHNSWVSNSSAGPETFLSLSGCRIRNWFLEVADDYKMKTKVSRLPEISILSSVINILCSQNETDRRWTQEINYRSQEFNRRLNLNNSGTCQPPVILGIVHSLAVSFPLPMNGSLISQALSVIKSLSPVKSR